MSYQKIIYFILLTIFTTLYTACSMKKVKLPKEENVKKVEVSTINYKLKKLSKKFIENCKATPIYDNNGSIYIKEYPNYLHINLGKEDDFHNDSTIILEEAKEKLNCIIPILKDEDKLYIVVTGHADSKTDKRKKQHLSDNRAITVAERFFDQGVRDEIFVKGCSDKPLEIDTYSKFTGKKINLYIYSEKANIKNHCK
jgi:outer membrane protein OmpA-like peptidoglycan-associated protein